MNEDSLKISKASISKGPEVELERKFSSIIPDEKIFRGNYEFCVILLILSFALFNGCWLWAAQLTQFRLKQEYEALESKPCFDAQIYAIKPWKDKSLLLN